MADYTLARHFPDAAEAEGEDRYVLLLRSVMERQASLIAQWQLVGFIHGVMNTDNMALSGETIDYGPCAFMDVYDPATVFSSIDTHGRYAYGNQPSIAAWNLARFAEALLPLLHDDEEQAIERAEAELSRFADRFRSYWLAGMRAKLGLFGEEPEDASLAEDLLRLMQAHRADYTNTFRTLASDKPEETAMHGAEAFAQWIERWRARRSRQPQTQADALRLMRSSSPAIIPRNHRVEEALEAAERGDYGVMERLLDALADPYAHTPLQEPYAAPPEPTAQRYRTYCGT